MNIFLPFLVFVLLFLPSFNFSAEPDPDGTLRILSHKQEVFYNTNCGETDTCDFKSFSITVEDYKITVNGEEFFGTRLFAEFETDTVDNLRNYGFVQFIKGCKFESFKVDDKQVRKLRTFSEYQFGEARKFHFPEWVIASFDEDPLYNGFSGENRLHYYRWNTVVGSYERGTEKFYGKEKPLIPRLYISDRPGPAFFSGRSAKNISLEFRMCIYKLSDIPRTTTENDVNFATPVGCLDWQSSWFYNHDTSTYENKKELDPFCLEK